MATIALIRSASVGVRPVVGSGVTSPTEKTPNCISISIPCPGGCVCNHPARTRGPPGSCPDRARRHTPLPLERRAERERVGVADPTGHRGDRDPRVREVLGGEGGWAG